LFFFNSGEHRFPFKLKPNENIDGYHRFSWMTTVMEYQGKLGFKCRVSGQLQAKKTAGLTEKKLNIMSFPFSDRINRMERI
jgi:hypothetical protein